MDLRAELMRRLAASNVARILVKQSQRRIRERGRDIGGYAALWADTATMKVKRRGRTVEIDHYRKGGVPLYDTGELFRSLTAEQQPMQDGVRLTLKGPLHAMFHQHGFKTSGPNRIPFTRAGVRGDRRAPALYAKRGVTVPARPIFAMPSEARREVARTIARALGAR